MKAVGPLRFHPSN